MPSSKPTETITPAIAARSHDPVTTPPVSRTLPPGDHAVLAIAADRAMLALVSDSVSCARFLTPDFIVAMLIEVGAGATGKVGDPASFTTDR